jgi:hypothetical protein
LNFIFFCLGEGQICLERNRSTTFSFTNSPMTTPAAINATECHAFITAKRGSITGPQLLCLRVQALRAGLLALLHLLALPVFASTANLPPCLQPKLLL